MKAYLYMVFMIFWTTQSALGQFYYIPNIFPTFQQPYFASPSIYYSPLTYDFSVPQNRFEVSQNLKSNDVSEFENNLKYTPADDEPSERFRGFGYHNKFNDEATSTVVFFSGFNQLNLDNANKKERITVSAEGVGEQASKNIEDSIKGIFSRKSTAQSSKFSPLTPAVKAFLESPQPSGSVYYFYSVPEVTQNSIESRALFGNQNSTSEESQEMNSTTTEKITRENETREISSNVDENKAKFVIEYKNHSSEKSSDVNTTSTTPEVSDSTTDPTTAMTELN